VEVEANQRPNQRQKSQKSPPVSVRPKALPFKTAKEMRKGGQCLAVTARF
jgi:hypothetical protein